MEQQIGVECIKVLYLHNITEMFESNWDICDTGQNRFCEIFVTTDARQWSVDISLSHSHVYMHSAGLYSAPIVEILAVHSVFNEAATRFHLNFVSM